jgi:integrase/recombinase XerC
MARPSKAWYWKERRCFAATVAGKRRVLAKGPDDAPTRARAARELHRILAEDPGARATSRPGTMTVAELADRFYDHAIGELADETGRLYHRRLREFKGACGAVAAADLRPFHVNEWLATRKWSAGTRRTAIVIVRRAFSWARKQGYLEADPLLGLEKPDESRREDTPSAESIRKLIEAAPNERFRDLIEAIAQTGCRPGEACKVEARHVDLEAATWTFRGKTTRKTKKMRVVYLTPKVVEICRRLVREHPEGPIFRNTVGTPWKTFSYGSQIRRLRKKLGLGPEVVAHGMRHLFVTDGLERGVSSTTIAVLAGHSGTAMIDRVYSHLPDRTSHLRDALLKIRPED